MRLRRLTRHVKDQNWFAVMLDFFIVVLGVFIGIQVANWNAARADANAERQLLERLHEEIVTAIQVDLTYREAFLGDRLADLETARHVIFGVTNRTILRREECQAIGLSHQPLLAPVTIPILKELSATGDIALIRDTDIVKAISEIGEIVDNAYLIEEALRTRVVILSRKFPDLITMTLEENAQVQFGSEIDPYDPLYICDSENMRSSPAFRNAAGENITNGFALLEFAGIPLRERLKALKSTLEDALGIEG